MACLHRWHRTASAPADFTKLPILSDESRARRDFVFSLRAHTTQAVIRESIDNDFAVLHVPAAHLFLLVTQLLEHSRFLFEVSQHQSQGCSCGVMPSKEEIECHILQNTRQPSDFTKEQSVGTNCSSANAIERISQSVNMPLQMCLSCRLDPPGWDPHPCLQFYTLTACESTQPFNINAVISCYANLCAQH